MAYTTLTATAMTMNTGTAVTQGAGTAIDATKTGRVLYPRHGKLIIWCDSTHANTTMIFSAGDLIANGKGTVTNAIGSGVAEMIIIDSDRFKDADGYVEWTYHADSTGFLRAFTVPQEA